MRFPARNLWQPILRSAKQAMQTDGHRAHSCRGPGLTTAVTGTAAAVCVTQHHAAAAHAAGAGLCRCAAAALQMGVGAFVMNSRREVLVVQERSGPLKGRGVWKMPTGLVGTGEDFPEAAERELLEETVGGGERRAGEQQGCVLFEGGKGGGQQMGGSGKWKGGR